ncbi:MULTISPECIES: helix-turn-helix domain-containing protein [Asticcacaulis]|uniref:AraC family transcriptional regulator n=1 Tax=Asticcacaulis TaxID=76890 RepID=UPI001AE3C411|nr:MULTISPECIES: helix-turn-helix domain-containing protein [Asticcacaulis]MBP2160719.1 AraC-like DNA-binding protein [Asticcacaulis solisilvae]MDR6801764.1 AraC-like DNA-binding protein [Asticcacaulis sp. BE141]
MKYEERAPSPQFAPFIERFWAFGTEACDPESYEHVIVPDGTANIAVIEPMPGGPFVSVAGPSPVAVRVPVQRGLTYRGARIRSGAWRAVMGSDVIGLVGQKMPMMMLSPELGAAIQSACGGADSLSRFAEGFEAALSGRPDHGLLDAEVCALAQKLVDSDGFAAMSDLMASSAIGERQLRRRFQRETGLSPKVFARLRRVRRACIDLAYQRSGNVATISADHGYADQPHFTRELKAVFGMSPLQLRAYLDQIRHFNLLELC